MAPFVKDREVPSVRLHKASLLERANGEIVIHGWLDLEGLTQLRVGPYQREILGRSGGHGARRTSLERALDNNESLPDVILGMRGEAFTTRGQDMYLENDIFIIDGLQRTSALRRHIEGDEKYDRRRPLIGAEIRLNTTVTSEKELFTKLNMNRVGMSPNVILRNLREEHNGLLSLYGLSINDKDFPLYGKISWNQRMNKSEVLTALTFLKTCLALYRHLGWAHTGAVARLPVRADNIVDVISLKVWRENISAFFEAVDDIWGIRGLKYSDLCTHLKGNFLSTLANLISAHENFWDGNRLVIDGQTKAKLKSFPIDDPTIMKLAASGDSSSSILFAMLKEHMNKRARANQLVERRAYALAKAKGKNVGPKRGRGLPSKDEEAA